MPATAATVICAAYEVADALAVHCTLLKDVQVEVAQLSRPKLVVAVASIAPKFRPVTVTEAPPVHGELLSICDETGESNVNVSVAVPATAATVRTA